MRYMCSRVFSLHVVPQVNTVDPRYNELRYTESRGIRTKMTGNECNPCLLSKIRFYESRVMTTFSIGTKQFVITHNACRLYYFKGTRVETYGSFLFSRSGENKRKRQRHPLCRKKGIPVFLSINMYRIRFQ